MDFVTNVRPDPIDLRDRMYNPTLEALREPFNANPFDDPGQVRLVKNQGQAAACTGFALSTYVERLLLARNPADRLEVSPWMLYYFARLYDELASNDRTQGSTARGGMKAWHRHGACLLEHWIEDVELPQTYNEPWVVDAFKRPLGAYYRVDHTSIPDMHAAINETGAVYATARIHPDWKTPENGVIRMQQTPKIVGGHAFLIVGYDEGGFWIQNSWGTDWGKNGFAKLTYFDWRKHGMDAWIGQLGVQVSGQIETLNKGLPQGQAAYFMLASDPNVSAQQINPYVVGLSQKGTLCSNGRFRTRAEDLDELVSSYFLKDIESYTTKTGIHVAFYAHGGVSADDSASDAAKKWIPKLREAGIFPVFFMWETGWKEILKYLVEEFLARAPEPAAASFWNKQEELKNDRIEGLVSGMGTQSWEEIKENARIATENPDGGLQLLYKAFERNCPSDVALNLRFHLIGHSVGSIFLCHLAKEFLCVDLKIDSVQFTAPACTVELFDQTIRPIFEQPPIVGGDPAYAQFMLSDHAEKSDNCNPMPYNRSLLYLISNAFEHTREKPLLGMQKFAVPVSSIKPRHAATWDFVTASDDCQTRSVEDRSCARSHLDFSKDESTIDAIVARIKQRM